MQNIELLYQIFCFFLFPNLKHWEASWRSCREKIDKTFTFQTGCYSEQLQVLQKGSLTAPSSSWEQTSSPVAFFQTFCGSKTACWWIPYGIEKLMLSFTDRRRNWEGKKPDWPGQLKEESLKKKVWKNEKTASRGEMNEERGEEFSCSSTVGDYWVWDPFLWMYLSEILALEKIPETTSLQTMRGEQVNLSQSPELKKSFCSRKP